MSDSTVHLPSEDGDPAWEAAYFFPPQGRWSEDQEQLVTVLTLDGEHFVEHGIFPIGQTATSHLLPGLSFPVDEIWALAKTRKS